MPNTLILAEHDQGKLKLATLSAVEFARQLCVAGGGSFHVLVLGHHIGPIVELLRPYGAAQVLSADHADLAHPLADRHAHITAAAARQIGATLVIGAASTFSKDILPRAAALLDAGMISDVVEGRPEGADFLFKRVLFAGNVIATVQLEGAVKVLTIRASAIPAAAQVGGASPVGTVSVDGALPCLTQFVAREQKAATRPDATEARIVVSGGRAIRNAEDFERLVGGLADTLGAAVGSSRALVDAGITANSLQIGQTGKVVAPDLYVAIGISGAIQHMAGMKDTKVVAAINKDSEAPIFEVADYGLVADVYEAVPQLISKLKA
ncbi:MAG: electron transfer flavoprotein subunit alpha/FixB family protein [Opitutae bacterium]|nr:electron transfer flavoprotein subunit alpha/FixB family protein [Opitutae bacterium]